MSLRPLNLSGRGRLLLLIISKRSAANVSSPFWVRVIRPSTPIMSPMSTYFLKMSYCSLPVVSTETEHCKRPEASAREKNASLPNSRSNIIRPARVKLSVTFSNVSLSSFSKRLERSAHVCLGLNLLGNGLMPMSLKAFTFSWRICMCWFVSIDAFLFYFMCTLCRF